MATTMAVLSDLLNRPTQFLQAGIFWIYKEGHAILPAVATLCNHAQEVGIDANLIAAPEPEQFTTRLLERLAALPPVSRPLPVGRDPLAGYLAELRLSLVPKSYRYFQQNIWPIPSHHADSPVTVYGVAHSLNPGDLVFLLVPYEPDLTQNGHDICGVASVVALV